MTIIRPKGLAGLNLPEGAIFSLALIILGIHQVHASGNVESYRNVSKLRDKHLNQNTTFEQVYRLSNSSRSPNISFVSTTSNASAKDFTATGNQAYSAVNLTTSNFYGFEDTKNSSQAHEELTPSDSLLIPQHANLRSDSDFDTATEDDGLEDADDSVDRASSNLNQKKMIRDLTKVISKGMSGATEQVRLDTLQNWKRKQQERKAIKDNRAKLFEDLLTAAIESRKETVTKKSSKKSTRNHDSFKVNPPSDPLGLASLGVDPELSTDAETVMRHIHGLSQAIDATSSTSGPESDFVSSNEEADVDENGSSSQSDGSQPKTKSSSSNERPIVKRFKKIKQQISQRRKQLDQIKKIFNVELALNPKDGSLMGKPASGSKKAKKEEHGQDIGDYTVIDDSMSSGKRRSKLQLTKSKELLDYLKENPDILESVVSELSGESARLAPSSSTIDDDIPVVPESFDNNRVDSFERKSHGYRESPSDDQSNYRQQVLRLDRFNEDGSPNNLLTFPRKPKQNIVDDTHNELKISTKSLKSPEILLLETLRERQLLNMARLEMVMAKRQQASDRSPVYSSLNSTQNSSFQGKSHSPEQQTTRETNMGTQKQRPTSNSRQSDEEVLHHFMMMDNQNFNDLQSKPELSFHSRLRSTLNSQPQTMKSQSKSFNMHNLSNPSRSETDLKQPQREESSLTRFREWTDVSQSEASSSSRNDKTNRDPNLSWLPYDLNTGGTSNSLSETRNPSAPAGDMGFEPRKANQQLDSRFSNTHVDLSITRPGRTVSSNLKLSDDTAFHHNGSSLTRSLSARKPHELQQPKGASPAPVVTENLPQPYRYDSDVRTDKTYRSESPEPDMRKTLRKSRHDSERIRYTGSAPKDYFSAYKTGEVSAKRETDLDDTDRLALDRLNDGDEEREDDLAGAMWAR